MRFHVWPAYFREIAEANMRCRFESVVFFCLALASGICAWLFRGAFGILFLTFIFSTAFALITLRKFLYARKYMMIDAYMDEGNIQILDHGNRVIKSVGYEQINGVEARTIELFAHGNAFGSSWRDCSSQKLIFIYINGARCFEDLRLEAFQSGTSRLFTDHWEVNRNTLKPSLYETSRKPKYWGGEIFFDDNCVALAFDDGAWRLLQAHAARTKTMG